MSTATKQPKPAPDMKDRRDSREKVAKEAVFRYLDAFPEATLTQIAEMFSIASGHACRIRSDWRLERARGEFAELAIDAIKRDPRMQMRPTMKQDVIDLYADGYNRNDPIPPIEVYLTDDGHYLTDGYYRLAALSKLGRKVVEARIKRGTVRDALLAAIQANATHGEHRDPETKRNAINALLDDPEWSEASTRKVADYLKVSSALVESVKAERENRPARQQSIRKGEGGTKVNGEHREDPPDVAESRATGRIPVGAEVTVTEPDEDEELADEDDAATGAHARAPQEAPEPTEDEWLDSLPLSIVLGGDLLKTFQDDARLYRRISEQVGTLKRVVARESNRLRRHGDYGYRIDRALRVEPPEKWIRCAATHEGGCEGKGTLPTGLKCDKCRGRGYRIP